ncbi:unnamed protein product [Dibothriocephalus latus]|uniref:Uncharacterized protein n=1 Tax=Dibothriocephalus latus TaxID=60516 RepID=A0A3P6R060_DIBLA|nr:unnamed protein product [Dibothriocephalus latus]
MLPGTAAHWRLYTRSLRQGKSHFLHPEDDELKCLTEFIVCHRVFGHDEEGPEITLTNATETIRTVVLLENGSNSTLMRDSLVSALGMKRKSIDSTI